MNVSGHLCGLVCLALAIVGFRYVTAAAPLAATLLEADFAAGHSLVHPNKLGELSIMSNLHVLSELVSAHIAEPARVAAVLTRETNDRNRGFRGPA